MTTPSMKTLRRRRGRKIRRLAHKTGRSRREVARALRTYDRLVAVDLPILWGVLRAAYLEAATVAARTAETIRALFWAAARPGVITAGVIAPLPVEHLPELLPSEDNEVVPYA